MLCPSTTHTHSQDAALCYTAVSLLRISLAEFASFHGTGLQSASLPGSTTCGKVCYRLVATIPWPTNLGHLSISGTMMEDYFPAQIYIDFTPLIKHGYLGIHPCISWLAKYLTKGILTKRKATFAQRITTTVDVHHPHKECALFGTSTRRGDTPDGQRSKTTSIFADMAVRNIFPVHIEYQ